MNYLNWKIFLSLVLISCFDLFAIAFDTVSPGYLTVAVSPAFPPVAYIDSTGQWQGSDVIFLRKFAESKGLQLKIVSSSLEDTWRLPAQGKVDMGAAGLSVLPSRELPGITYSKPYFEVERTYIVRKEDAEKIKKMTDLNGKKVGRVADSIPEVDLKKNAPNSKRVAFSNAEAGINDLLSGKIDAFGDGNITADMFAKEHKGLAVVARHTFDSQAPETFSFAINDKSKGLLGAIDDYIGEGANGVHSENYMQALRLEPRSIYATQTPVTKLSLVPDELKKIPKVTSPRPAILPGGVHPESSIPMNLPNKTMRNEKLAGSGAETKIGKPPPAGLTISRTLGGAAILGLGYALWTGYDQYKQTAATSIKEENRQYISNINAFFSLTLDQQTEIRWKDPAFDQFIFEQTSIPTLSSSPSCTVNEISFSVGHLSTPQESQVSVTFKKSPKSTLFDSTSVSMLTPTHEMTKWSYRVEENKIISMQFKPSKKSRVKVFNSREIEQIRKDYSNIPQEAQGLFELGYNISLSPLQSNVQQCCANENCQKNITKLIQYLSKNNSSASTGSSTKMNNYKENK